MRGRENDSYEQDLFVAAKSSLLKILFNDMLVSPPETSTSSPQRLMNTRTFPVVSFRATVKIRSDFWSAWSIVS